MNSSRKHDDDGNDRDSQSSATGGDADLSMLMCGECEEEPEAMGEGVSAELVAGDGDDLTMMMMCGECEETGALDESSREADPAPPPRIDEMKTAHDAKRLPGNSLCFECDAPLTPWRDPWLSLTYGTLLCAACAQQHLALGTASGIGSLVSSVRPRETPPPPHSHQCAFSSGAVRALRPPTHPPTLAYHTRTVTLASEPFTALSPPITTGCA